LVVGINQMNAEEGEVHVEFIEPVPIPSASLECNALCSKQQNRPPYHR